MQSWFLRNSQRETSYLEFSNAYQKVRVCMQIAIVEQSQSFLKAHLLTLTDILQTEMKRESSLQASIYRHLQLAGYSKYLKGTGREEKVLSGNPNPSRAAAWGLLAAISHATHNDTGLLLAKFNISVPALFSAWESLTVGFFSPFASVTGEAGTVKQEQF